MKKRLLFFVLLSCSTINAQTIEQKLLAKQGNAAAQVELGHVYLEKYYAGDDNEHEAKVALNWFAKAAEQGNAEAMYYLGSMYTDGYGVEESEVSEKIGEQWLAKAAANNQADALELFAYRAFKDEDYPKAEALYLKAAERGSVRAAEELADRYLYSSEFPQSLPNAIKWYEAASQLGASRAMAIMGKLYFYGKGVEESDSQAKAWFEKAYAEGHSDAATGLGNLYRLGRGVEQSDHKAIEYYLAAIDIDEKDNEGLYHLTEYAVAGKINQQTELAAMLLDSVRGSGAIQSMGMKQANFLLGKLFSTGQFVEQSDDVALGSFADAIHPENDETYAQFARFYASGKGDKDVVSRADLLCTSYWLEKQSEKKYTPIALSFESRLSSDFNKDDLLEARQFASEDSCFSSDIILLEIISTSNY